MTRPLPEQPTPYQPLQQVVISELSHPVRMTQELPLRELYSCFKALQADGFTVLGVAEDVALGAALLSAAVAVGASLAEGTAAESLGSATPESVGSAAAESVGVGEPESVGADESVGAGTSAPEPLSVAAASVSEPSVAPGSSGVPGSAVPGSVESTFKVSI